METLYGNISSDFQSLLVTLRVYIYTFPSLIPIPMVLPNTTCGMRRTCYALSSSGPQNTPRRVRDDNVKFTPFSRRYMEMRDEDKAF